MCPDLTLQPTVITAADPGDLAWVYQGAEGSRPSPTDLDDLAVEVDWGRLRTLWMLYGACDPATLEAVLARVSDCSRVVVLECDAPDAYHLTAAEREQLMAHVLADRLALIVGGTLTQRADALVRMVDINRMDGWKPILSNARMALQPDETRELFGRIASGVDTKVMTKGTHMIVTLPYLRNALINAPLADGAAHLGTWKDSRRDRPVLIVSAGPSLNKQLPLLAENQDLFTILAVDTVWPILNKHGIVPDAMLAIDRISKPSWPRNGVSQDTAFCVDLGCAPRLVWSNDHNHVISTCNPYIYAILADVGAKAEFLPTGGSVATSAFSMAEMLGSNPIVFIGQDLALTDGKDHAEGYPHTYSAKTLTQRTENGFDVEGYYGGKVRTERQLMFYKNWLEGRIQGLSERLIINATEGGARIAGALQLPFEAVCREIRSTSLRKAPLMAATPSRIDPAHVRTLQDGLARLTERVRGFGEFATEARALCRRAGSRPSKRQLTRIDAINQAIKDWEPLSKQVVDVMSMVKLDKIRYKAYRGQDMHGMADVLKKYDEVYENIEAGAAMALTMFEHIQAFYVRVLERGEIDPQMAQSVFPD